jgi:hypothetical protein
MSRLLRVLMLLLRLMPLAALTLIGVGLWLIYPPAAFLGIGLLVWIDLHRKDSKP